MTLLETSKIVVSNEQVSCDLAGEAAILSLKNGVHYGLDPVGARIWTLIQAPRTFVELGDILLREYDLNTPRLESDMRGLLDQLAQSQLVEISA